MARAQADKIYATFVKGLITEAEALTFPEHSSFDEDNCVLSSKGNRTRRKSMDYEDSYTKSTTNLTTSTIGSTVTVKSGIWDDPAADADASFLVVQVGTTLEFYDATSTPLGSNKKAFTVNLSTYAAPAATNIGDTPVTFTTGKGLLFVTSKKVKPFFVTYDSGGDTISETLVDIKTRDFEGINDGLANDERQNALTTAHEYNLYNQGWDLEPNYTPSNFVIAEFNTEFGDYPSNADIYAIYASDDPGTHSAVHTQQKNVNLGNALAPRGHFILDAFNKDRDAASGLTGIADVTEDLRPTAQAFHFGRIFYGGTTGKIYFSQVINDDLTNVGFCHQVADPASTEDSVLVATDGGELVIPEASEFVSFVSFGATLLVFAKNGLWTITGTDGGFRANDFSIQKIGTIGAVSEAAVVLVEGQPMWVAKEGLYTVDVDRVSGDVSYVSLSDNTIKSFFQDIPSASITNMRGIYNPDSKLVQWLFKSDAADGFNSLTYDRVLNFDTRLQSFYPWTISKLASDTPYITDGFTIQDVKETFYLTVVPDTGTLSKYVFSQTDPTNISYLDWKEEDSTGITYSSFLTTGYETAGDPMRVKGTPYIFIYMKKTETGFTGDETNGYDLINPSSLMLTGLWEWSDHENSGRITTPQQVYKPRRNYVPDSGDLNYDTGFPVVVSKTKIPGKGLALQLKFESEDEKDFNLLGWGIHFEGNTNV